MTTLLHLYYSMIVSTKGEGVKTTQNLLGSWIMEVHKVLIVHVVGSSPFRVGAAWLKMYYIHQFLTQQKILVRSKLLNCFFADMLSIKIDNNKQVILINLSVLSKLQNVLILSHLPILIFQICKCSEFINFDDFVKFNVCFYFSGYQSVTRGHP